MIELVDYFDGSPVFTVTLPTEPESQRFWFRASEICRKLEFSDSFRTISEITKDRPFSVRELKVGLGRPAQYITLSIVTRLMMKSKAPCAVAFQDWLHDDLLPKLFAGTYKIVTSQTQALTTPQQAQAIATPNTSKTDQVQFLYRDSQLGK